MADETVFTPDVEFVASLKEAGAETMKRCYQCATCSVVCELSTDERPFPRKEMLMAQWGLKDELVRDPNIWLCHNCNDCTKYCPRGAKPGDVLGVLRQNVIMENAYPKFMGKLGSDPNFMVFAFGLPILLFLVILGATGYLHIPDGPVIFDNFFPVKLIDPIFITVALIAVGTFAVSIKRFWNMINVEPYKVMANARFLPSLIETLKEIMLHKKFNKCGANSDRTLAHRLVFFGFIGLFITTNVAVFNMYVLGWDTPYRIDDPNILKLFGSEAVVGLYYAAFKLFGNISAIALIVGGVLMLTNRKKDRGFVSNSSSFDWIFAIVILLLAVTGFVAQLLRFLDVPALAYPVYFLHLVFVFYIIAYLPYSKLAHIVYRTVAITYAKMAKIDVDSAATKGN